MIEWKGCITRHRGVLYLKVKDASGLWVERSTKLEDTPRNRELASARLEDVRRKLQGSEPSFTLLAGTTVRAWATQWLEDRREQGLADCANDSARLQQHVFPLIGDLPIQDVRPRHAHELVRLLRIKNLAPRTVRNIYYLVRAMFRDAEISELIPLGTNPCILTKRQLGKLRDKTPGWRHTAVFTRNELELLVSDPRLPPDHRVWNALLGLGMLRTGEAAGLRLRHLQLDEEPLGRILVLTSYDDGNTKTELERWMPIHPTLKAVLAEWLLAGWAREFGRHPGADDLVCPVTEEQRKGRKKPVGVMRDRHYAWKRFQWDLKELGFRRRRAHDLRRTGISLARGDGALKEILRWGTHAPDRDVMSLYTSIEWEKLCAEVAKLKVGLPRGAVVRLPARQPVS